MADTPTTGPDTTSTGTPSTDTTTGPGAGTEVAGEEVEKDQESTENTEATTDNKADTEDTTEDTTGKDSEDTTSTEDNPEEDDNAEGMDRTTARKFSRLRNECSNLRTRAKGAEKENLRLQAAYNGGLPPSALKFLTGDTKEELEANAADLIAMMGNQERGRVSGVPRESGTSTSEAPSDKPENLDDIANRMYNS